MAVLTVNQIGVRCSWSVCEFLGPRSMVEDRIKEVGLNPNLLPRNTMKKAVGRASKAVSKKENGRFESLPPRKLADNHEKAVYALLREKVDSENEHGEWSQETTVKLDKENRKVEASGEKAPEFLAAYEKYAECVTDHDIRQFCRAVVALSFGIPYNPSGHDYMVPERFQSNMTRLDSFLRNMGVGRMWLTPAIDDAGSLEVTWEKAQEYIADQIDGVLGNVEKFTSRVKCLRDKGERLTALKEMTSMYAKMTERAVAAETLMAAINEGTEQIAAKIEEIETGRAAKEKDEAEE